MNKDLLTEEEYRRSLGFQEPKSFLDPYRDLMFYIVCLLLILQALAATL